MAIRIAELEVRLGMNMGEKVIVSDVRYEVNIEVKTIIRKYGQLEVICPACSNGCIRRPMPWPLTTQSIKSEVCLLLELYAGLFQVGLSLSFLRVRG